MDKVLFNAMLSRFQKEILQNKEKIESLYKIDMKYCKMEADIRKFIDIIESYKGIKFESNTKERLIFCNGNPYIVLNLAMLAICTNFSLTINIDDLMIGVNTSILEIINSVLKENEMDVKLYILKNADIKKNNAKTAIFLDRVNDYNVLKKNYESTKFIPYQGIDVFCDNEEYDELLQKIYACALDMNIDIEIFYEDEGIESIFKLGSAKKVLLLTKEEVVLDKNTNKQIYVNKNPLDQECKDFKDSMVNLLLQF